MNHRPTPPTIKLPGLIGVTAAVWLASLLAGCSQPWLGSGGALQITSRDGGRQIIDEQDSALRFDDGRTQAIYRYDDDNTVTVLLIRGSRDHPDHVATLRMFWKARAGSTPIDRTATNALVRYFEFRDAPGDTPAPGNTPDDSAANEIEDDRGTVGVYAGAGFMRLHDDPTLGRVTGSLWDADLRLTDRSETYTDRLGRAVLAGSFTADRDDAAVTTMLRDLNQRIEQRLGYPRLVRVEPTHSGS